MTHETQYTKKEKALPLKMDNSSSILITVAELAFTNFHESKNLEMVAPVSIYTDVDKSVNFIGSTISVLKPLLDQGIPEDGVFMNQPCLRTQNMRLFYEDDIDIEYNSFFNSSTTLAPAEKLNETVVDAVEYLDSLQEGLLDRLVIRVSSEHEDLLGAIENSGFNGSLEIDGREEGYYNWGYGKNGIRGRGLTLSVKSLSSDNYRDIGNIVVIDKNKVPLAVEWGYGTETLLSRVYDLRQPLEASAISEIIPFKPGLTAKFSDAFAASIEMYQAGVTPSDKGARFILKEYLRGLSYLRRRLSIDTQDLETYGKLYLSSSQASGGNDETHLSAMIDWIESYEQRVNKYTDAVLRYTLYSDRPLTTGDVDLDKVRQKNGVHIKESHKIISQTRRINER